MTSRSFRTFFVLLGLIPLNGCASLSVGDIAREREALIEILEVRQAIMDDDAIYVELEAKSRFGRRPKSHILRFPLDAGAWVEEEGEQQSTTQTVFTYGRNPKIRLGPLPAMAWSKGMPDGDRIPIHEMTLEEYRHRLRETDEDVTPLEVLVVRPEPAEAAALIDGGAPYRRRQIPSRRFLTFGGTPAYHGVVVDFYDGTYRYWGWYALLPAAVAVDIATAPIQLAIFFYWSSIHQ